MKQHQDWEEKNPRSAVLPKRPIQTSAVNRGDSTSKRPKLAQDDEVDDEQMKQVLLKNEVAKVGCWFLRVEQGD